MNVKDGSEICGEKKSLFDRKKESSQEFVLRGNHSVNKAWFLFRLPSKSDKFTEPVALIYVQNVLV